MSSEILLQIDSLMIAEAMRELLNDYCVSIDLQFDLTPRQTLTRISGSSRSLRRLVRNKPIWLIRITFNNSSPIPL
jgi:hypothetical protein